MFAMNHSGELKPEQQISSQLGVVQLKCTDDCNSIERLDAEAHERPPCALQSNPLVH